MKITIAEAVAEGLRDMPLRSNFSLIGLTRFVEGYRGKLVTDGSVSRELRHFNEKLNYKGWDIKWEVVKNGVYILTRMERMEVRDEEKTNGGY